MREAITDIPKQRARGIRPDRAVPRRLQLPETAFAAEA